VSAYDVNTSTTLTHPVFGEVYRAYFDGATDLVFDVDAGTAAAVETLTSARPVGLAIDPDASLRLSWWNDAGNAQVEYVSRDGGGTWASV
jgi:hypothetical protein